MAFLVCFLLVWGMMSWLEECLFWDTDYVIILGSSFDEYIISTRFWFGLLSAKLTLGFLT